MGERLGGKFSPPWERGWGGSFFNFPPIMGGKLGKFWDFSSSETRFSFKNGVFWRKNHRKGLKIFRLRRAILAGFFILSTEIAGIFPHSNHRNFFTRTTGIFPTQTTEFSHSNHRNFFALNWNFPHPNHRNFYSNHRNFTLKPQEFFRTQREFSTLKPPEFFASNRRIFFDTQTTGIFPTQTAGFFGTQPAVFPYLMRSKNLLLN